MLVRLLYASRVAEPFGAEAMQALLRQAKAKNDRLGITGLLCHCPGTQTFLQVLEGGRRAVNALYGRLVNDERHRDVELLAYQEIAERRFAGWSMGQVNMGRLNVAQVLRYAETPVFDPYALSGGAAVALFEELVATGSILGQG